MLWPLTVVLVTNTNGRLAIPALAGLLVLYNEELTKRAEMQTLSDKIRTMETETMESHVMRLSEDKPGARPSCAGLRPEKIVANERLPAVRESYRPVSHTVL